MLECGHEMEMGFDWGDNHTCPQCFDEAKQRITDLEGRLLKEKLRALDMAISDQQLILEITEELKKVQKLVTEVVNDRNNLQRQLFQLRSGTGGA